MSTADLARRLGVARTTVVARLARLERTGVVVGWAADDVFHSSPIGLLVGLGLGIVGAVSALISLLKRWS